MEARGSSLADSLRVLIVWILSVQRVDSIYAGLEWQHLQVTGGVRDLTQGLVAVGLHGRPSQQHCQGNAIHPVSSSALVSLK